MVCGKPLGAEGLLKADLLCAVALGISRALAVRDDDSNENRSRCHLRGAARCLFAHVGDRPARGKRNERHAEHERRTSCDPVPCRSLGTAGHPTSSMSNPMIVVPTAL